MEASCCEGDPSFSSLVLGKLLHQLVEVFAETEGPCLKKGEDEEEENLMKLAGRVLKVMPLKKTIYHYLCSDIISSR